MATLKKCNKQQQPYFRLKSHWMTHSLPKMERRFNCANTIESWKCFRCSNFETCLMVELRQHLETRHMVPHLKRKPYQCGNRSLLSRSKRLHSRHKLFGSRVKNRRGRSEAAQSGDVKLENGCAGSQKPSKPVLNPVNMVQKYEKEKSLKYCEHCSYSTVWMGNLRQHIVRKHPDVENIGWVRCKLCPVKVETKSLLLQHIVIDHPNQRTFKCDHCQFETKFKQSLQRHVNTKHTNAEKNHIFVKQPDPDDTEWFYCTLCSYKSEVELDLKKHMNNKHGDDEPKFKCEHCSHEFESKRNLEKHILRKHTDPNKSDWLTCQYCTYKTKMMCSLNKHVDSKHGEKEETIILTSCHSPQTGG